MKALRAGAESCSFNQETNEFRAYAEIRSLNAGLTTGFFVSKRPANTSKAVSIHTSKALNKNYAPA